MQAIQDRSLFFQVKPLNRVNQTWRQFLDENNTIPPQMRLKQEETLYCESIFKDMPGHLRLADYGDPNSILALRYLSDTLFTMSLRKSSWTRSPRVASDDVLQIMIDFFTNTLNGNSPTALSYCAKFLEYGLEIKLDLECALQCQIKASDSRHLIANSAEKDIPHLRELSKSGCIESTITLAKIYGQKNDQVSSLMSREYSELAYILQSREADILHNKARLDAILQNLAR